MSEAGRLAADARDLLERLLRIDTTNPPGNETAAARLLHDFLAPLGAECELVSYAEGRANLVARVRGAGTAPSLALLCHTDVVPAGDGWTHPPFAGHRDDDGWIWGRGALDMKGQVATHAAVLASLARSEQPPPGDVVLLATADEETGGAADVGLRRLVRERPDVRCALALNEGGGRRLVLADGRPVVLVSVGEKAALRVRITVRGRGGHAAFPATADNPLLKLGPVLGRCLPGATETRMTALARRMLDDLGAPDVASLELAAVPELSSLVDAATRTTIAPTLMAGSAAANVIPDSASVVLDCRLVPGTTWEDVREELRRVLGPDVACELTAVHEPLGGSSSSVDSPLWDACRAALVAEDPGVIPIPILLPAFTDSHWMRAAFGTVAYGLWPLRHTSPELFDATVHACDERVHEDDLGYAARITLDICRRLGKTQPTAA